MNCCANSVESSPNKEPVKIGIDFMKTN